MMRITKFPADGFSLVEILMGLAVLSVAMIGIAQLSVKDANNSNSQSQDYDFTIMSSNLGLALQNDCTNILSGQNLTLGSSPNLTVPTSLPTPFEIISTAPSTQAGIHATSVTFSKLTGPVFVASDGTKEFLSIVTLTAKKFLAGGGLDPKSLPFAKEFEIDAWVNPANQIMSCQKVRDPSGSSLALTTPSTVCPGASVSGTWAITSGVVKEAFLVSDTNQYPAVIASATGGTFSFVLPTTPGPSNHTFTLFLAGSGGERSWGNSTAQSFIIHINGTPPCP